MSKDYGIIPSKQHYGCMIDLLCRAGRLSEADRMIKSMPFEQDNVIWSTLLRAGRDHGDIDCARRAAQKILELDPNCAGTHVTLANLYAAKGRWKEVADLRKMMKSKGVIKDPGWSWIKVADQVTAFVSGDCSHAEHEDIYNILDLIALREDMAIKDTESLLNYNED
uniref:Pentatricopeptide repeat-containing protein n=1 Tax=Rhizophora mucronata TaxID=61149 RepID=A0A2P2Q4G9_RHIMU